MASMIGTWTGVTWSSGGQVTLTKVAPAGPNRLLIALYGTENTGGATPVTALTYGGQNLTLVKYVAVGTTVVNTLGVYYLAEPGISMATSSSLGITFTGSPPNAGYELVAGFISGANQATVIGDSESASNTAASGISSPALSPTNNGDLAFGLIVNSSSSYSSTYINNFSKVYTGAHPSGFQMDLGQKSCTGVSETPGVTGTGTNRLAIIGFVVKEMTNQVKDIISYCQV